MIMRDQQTERNAKRQKVSLPLLSTADNQLHSLAGFLRWKERGVKRRRREREREREKERERFRERRTNRVVRNIDTEPESTYY